MPAVFMSLPANELEVFMDWAAPLTVHEVMNRQNGTLGTKVKGCNNNVVADVCSTDCD